MKIKFAKLKEDVKIPSKYTSEDAGLDIYAHFDEDFIVIGSHSTKIIKTGLASVIEPGYFVKLCERGSTGTKGIAQRSGVIDSGYRGEWGIPVTNTNNSQLIIAKDNIIDGLKEKFGDKAIIYPYSKAICQAVILPCPEVEIDEISIDELENAVSERGKGALGSSRK